MTSTVKIDINGKVALLTLNRPDVLNAWNWDLVTDMQQATFELRHNDNIRAVVLTGAGRGFSAGADLAGRGGTNESLTPAVSVEDGLNRGYLVSLRNIIEMPKPVISAVNGPAAGIGAAFAMACDLSVMSEKAYIMLAFSNIGLVPDGGANWLLTRAVGYRKALEYALEATKIDAQECLRTGLANKVTSAEALMSTSMEWAEKLAKRSKESTKLTKRLMRDAANDSYLQIFAKEAEYQGSLVGSNDNKEAVQAFLEKRAPNFE